MVCQAVCQPAYLPVCLAHTEPACLSHPYTMPVCLSVTHTTCMHICLSQPHTMPVCHTCKLPSYLSVTQKACLSAALAVKKKSIFRHWCLQVKKGKFAALLQHAQDHSWSPAIVKSGFERTGIWPVNISKIDKKWLANQDEREGKMSNICVEGWNK